MKQVILITVPVLLMITLFANSQTKMSRKEYIDTYKTIAIREMHRSGIPASITMAQGCLESGNGNSALARKSNNHFGIKCRNDWKGARVYHHDDKLNECFRKYRTVEESYIDHTDFLVQNTRYGALFSLSHTDYVAWARGLKAAGYATDPKYAERLIKIIKDEQLHLLDDISIDQLAESYDTTMNTSNDELPFAGARDKVIKSIESIRLNPFANREIKNINGLDAITARADDTYESIAREFELKNWEVHHYNDLDRDEVQPKVNEIIYLERKRYNAPKGYDFHVAKPGESMWSISQKYGMKLSRLYRLNRMEKNEQVKTGTRLYLRRKKPKE